MIDVSSLPSVSSSPSSLFVVEHNADKVGHNLHDSSEHVFYSAFDHGTRMPVVLKIRNFDEELDWQVRTEERVRTWLQDRAPVDFR